MRTIIVTGSKGQLGSEIRDLSREYPDLNFMFFSREEFPINDEALVRKILEEHRPFALLNCAAYTAVDKSETDQEAAMDVNGKAPGNLAALCAETGARFIHVSTDYVFSGEATMPLREIDTVAPLNFYGSTKLEGEQRAMEANPESIIIRTSWVYSSHGKNFVKTMLRLMSERDSIGVVNDQVGSPTYARDLAMAMMQIVTGNNWTPGIYHYSNTGDISWYDFATEIRDQSGSTCNVNPIRTSDFPTPAKRPAYSVMNTDKIATTFGIEIKNWKESLAACLQKLQES